MFKISNETKDFNFDNEKEKVTQIYDKIFELIECLNLQLKDREEKHKTILILQKIIDNILKNKTEEKYRTLKFSNKSLKEYIFCRKVIVEFLSFLGFVELEIDSEKCFVLLELDESLFEITGSNILLNLQDDSNKNTFEVEKEEKLTDEEENKKKFIEELKMSRDNFLINNPPQKGVSNPNFGKTDFSKVLKDTAHIRKQNLNENYLRNQIDYKSNIKNQTPSNRIITLNDLKESDSFLNIKSTDNSYNSTSTTAAGNYSARNDVIGKKCLELTNEFRKRNNMSLLKWDDEIWTISLGHSKNMGEKKVPFSHEGFNNRINSLKFSFMAAFENVFYCHGYQSDIAELAVNGWINSPGHRKNMLSNSNHCAIATYKNSNGEYYLTQIFIKKN